MIRSFGFFRNRGKKMKFMKLGSKPDASQTDGNSVRFMLSELATDVVINVGEVKFHLHKFPLLSKSNKLRKLVSRCKEESSDEIDLVNFPGGSKAFEICAKFCYGIIVTLNPYNVVAARCAAEYLEMTEEVEKGNLTLKIDVFLNSSVLRSWKDSIIVLQTTSSLLPWSENLHVIGRCIDSIASRTSVDPSIISWSYSNNRKPEKSKKMMIQSGTKELEKTQQAPKDWWVEDVCELDIELYKRAMISIKSKGKMDGGVICEAIRAYAVRWLPDSVEMLASKVESFRNKSVVETLILLLPTDKDITCSCSFLLELLKVAILVEAEDFLRQDLVRSVGSRLNEASVDDLLIPATSPQTTIYNIELVQHLVDRFMTNSTSDRDSRETDKNESDFALGHGSMLKVGKMIDDYLTTIGSDPNVSIDSFMVLSRSVPESARPVHDGLYSAIDVYLKAHPSLSKAERKSLCRLINVKKLSSEVSLHAAQNEKLPLRLVVQVLYFEQARKLTKMEVKEEDLNETGKLTKRGSKNRVSGGQLMPSRSRRIFDKLWNVGKVVGTGENKSSETSASSQSPISIVQGETKSSSSSSRHRRYSIS